MIENAATIDTTGDGAVALPPLPIEQHAVTAALALTEMDQKVKLLLWFMSNDPRSPHVATTFVDLGGACQRAYEAHLLHRELLECRGRG